MIKIGSKAVVGSFERNRLGYESLSPMGVTDFKNLMNNQYIRCGPTKKELGTFWLKSTHRRTYHGYDLEPGEPQDLPDDKLNLWRGWGVQPREGDWTLTREHIRVVLASGIEEHYDYIIKFLAWKLQNPKLRPEVALGFRGEEGCGKGIIFNRFAKIFGANGVTVGCPEDLTGGFNAHLRGALFVYANEAFFAGDPSAASKILRLVTEPTVMIQQKFVDKSQDQAK